MSIKILRINIVQSIDCHLKVTNKKHLEKFRKDLMQQCKIGVAEDKISVDFVIQEPKNITI